MIRGAFLVKVVAVAALLVAGSWAVYANVTSRGSMDMTMRISAADSAFPVSVASVERAAIRGTVVYTGAVAPFNEEDVYPRVTGRIVDMPVYPGDAVRPGQLVARLDDVELTSRVREADAMAATAHANRAQMEADVLAARFGVGQMERELAMVEAELTYARSVAARSQRLVASGAISRQEYENDRSMAASLEAKREAAQAKLEQARAMESSARRKVEAAESMVAQGQAAARTAAVVRDYVNITSKGAGYVVKRLVAPGVLVQPGMAILKIAQIDRVRLQANVGEKDLGSIKVGSPVVVTPAGADQSPVTAKVTSVFPFVDPGARTAVVEAIVENGSRRFLPGQYVRMEFVTGAREAALTVPQGAVARLGAKSTVWVVQDDRVQPRAVTTGLQSADRVEVTSGVAAGERVVAQGREGLYAGARIALVAPPGQLESETASPDGNRQPSGAPEMQAGAPDVQGMDTKPEQAAPKPVKPKGGGHAGH